MSTPPAPRHVLKEYIGVGICPRVCVIISHVLYMVPPRVAMEGDTPGSIA